MLLSIHTTVPSPLTLPRTRFLAPWVVLCLALLPLAGAARASAAEKMAIEITRDKVTANATLGKMSVDGRFLCYTLEPAPGGGPKGKGPIPAGTYNGHLRYDHSDRWRIELDNVPGFTHVQIHVGNVPKDTAGCVLVGTDRDERRGELKNSKDAYALLKRAFYGTDTPKATPDKEISVTLAGTKE